jgi:hypothetical protein
MGERHWARIECKGAQKVDSNEKTNDRECTGMGACGADIVG